MKKKKSLNSMLLKQYTWIEKVMGSQIEYNFQKPGLKTGMYFRGQVRKWHVLVWEPGGTSPPRISKSTPPGQLSLSYDN